MESNVARDEQSNAPRVIRLESDFSPLLARVIAFLYCSDDGFVLLRHVLSKHLLVALAMPPILGLHNKLGLSHWHSTPA